MIRALTRKRLRDDRGFTLVELLVVVVIIGILVAIAIPIFLNQRAAAQDRAVESDIRNAIPVMETYYADHGAYPDSATNAPAEESEAAQVFYLEGSEYPITVSEDVVLTISGNGQTYTITGEHSATGNEFQYDSETGEFGEVESED